MKLAAMRFVAFGALGEERTQSKRHFDRLRWHHDNFGIVEKNHFVVLKIFQLRVGQRRSGLEKTSDALRRFALKRRKQTRLVLLVVRIEGRFFLEEKIQTFHVVALVAESEDFVLVGFGVAYAKLDGSFHGAERFAIESQSHRRQLRDEQEERVILKATEKRSPLRLGRQVTQSPLSPQETRERPYKYRHLDKRLCLKPLLFPSFLI